MKTIILAGGLGTRLSEETTVKPKPMVEIGDKPILWHIMKLYSFYNHNEFLIALGYKGEVIKDYFLNYTSYANDIFVDTSNGEINLEGDHSEDWKIGLVSTGLHSMTGGRILNLKKYIPKGESFMVTYGDGVANVDINKLIRFHKKHGKIATLTAVRPVARFGNLDIDNTNLINTFKEKPQTGEGWINGGFFVFNYEIFNYLENNSTILEREPLEKLAENGQLMAYKHFGFGIVWTQ